MVVQSQASEVLDVPHGTARVGSRRGIFSDGIADFTAGLKAWPLWTMLGWNDIRQRYRRSVLGPFWITISMALFTILLGVVYSRIFDLPIAQYLPYVAMGLIVWGFISSTSAEGCNTFIENGVLIKQIKLPYSMYVFRTVWRAFIVFLHTVVLIIPIELLFGSRVGVETLLFVPGILIVILNQTWLGIVLAVLSTRFRDIPPLVQTAIQITMFATPIMWPVSALGDATIIADVNPVHHLVELARAPLLGEAPALLSWAVGIGLCVGGFTLAIFLLSRASRRAVYWL
jgi:ABC-type polysaccharide/polyol phosphate export permease